MTALRTVARSAAGPVAVRAAPLFMAVAIVAGILFGPTGMQPGDLVQLSDNSPWVRLIFWLMWLLLAAPVALPPARGDRLDYLRWLPIPPWQLWVLSAILILLIELPWAALWLTGAGPWIGGSAWLSMAAAHACWALVPSGAVGHGLRLGLLGSGAAILLAIGPGLALAVWSGLALIVAVPMAWRRGLERSARPSRRPLAGHPVLALAQCHLRCLLRTRSWGAIRAVMLVGLFAGLAGLIGRANPDMAAADLAALWAGGAALATALAGASLATAILDSERALRWITDSAGLHPDRRLAARALSLAGVGSVLGLVYVAVAVAVAERDGLPVVRIAAGSLTAAVATTILAGRAAHWAELDDERRPTRNRRLSRAGDSPGTIDGERVVSAMAGAVLATIAGLAVLGDAAVLLLLAGAAAASVERPR
ncbi:MAG: hypothetical protein AAGC55_24865 [Myxococcota bacterium]